MHVHVTFGVNSIPVKRKFEATKAMSLFASRRPCAIGFKPCTRRDSNMINCFQGFILISICAPTPWRALNDRWIGSSISWGWILKSATMMAQTGGTELRR